MASPTIRAYGTPTNGEDALPAFTVNQPAGVVTGDLLIAFAAGDGVNTPWIADPGNGWTRLGYTTNGSTHHQAAIYAKVATGTDTLSISAQNNADYSVVMVAITTGTHGVTNVSTDIVLPAPAFTALTTAADPPASGTVASKDWLAFAVAMLDFTATTNTLTAVPTNYTTGVLTQSASSTSAVGLGVGHRALTAATSEDPGTFTHTGRPWIAWTILVPDPTVATDHSRSQTDPVGVTDTATPAKTTTATVTDGIGVTDTAVSAKTITVSVTDGIGITTPGAPLDVSRTVTDEVGLTDSASVSSSGGEDPPIVDYIVQYRTADVGSGPGAWQSFPDGISTVTGAVVTGLTPGTLYDFRVAAVNEAGPGAWSNITTCMATGDAVVEFADPVGLTDVVVTARSIVRTVTDLIGVTDTVALTRDVIRTVTDPVGIADETATNLQGADSVTTTDLVGITDAATRTHTAVRTVTDTVGILDTAVPTKTISVTVTDDIGVSDTATRTHTAVRTVTDPVGMADETATNQQGADSVTTTDLVGITDAATRTHTAVRTVTDTVGVTDTVTAAKSISVTVTDDIGVSDATDREISLTVTVTDSIGVADSQVLVEDDAATIADNIGILDAATRIHTAVRTVTDNVGISDSVAAFKGLRVTVTDDIGITDSTVEAEAVTVTVTDPIGVADAATADTGAEVATDPVGILDTVVISRSVRRTVTDPIGITDLYTLAGQEVDIRGPRHISRADPERGICPAVYTERLIERADQERKIDPAR